MARIPIYCGSSFDSPCIWAYLTVEGDAKPAPKIPLLVVPGRSSRWKGIRPRSHQDLGRSRPARQDGSFSIE